MQMTRALNLRPPDDRTLRRLILGMSLVLAIGIPLIGVLYFFDQYRAPAPSISDQTIQAAEAAVRKNPNSLEVRYALGNAYDTAGRIPDAIAQYDEILKVKPDAAVVLIARGNDFVAQGKLDSAKADFQAVVKNGQGAAMANVDSGIESAHYGLALIALKAGDPRTAASEATAALQINRTDADALNVLGDALAATGDLTTATVVYGRAVSLVPDGWCDPYKGLAKTFASLGNQPGAGWSNGMLALCQGRYDEAQAMLRQQVGGAFDLDALNGLGLLAEKQGQNDQAASYYRQVLAKDPRNFAANNGMTRVGAVEASAGPASPTPTASVPGSN